MRWQVASILLTLTACAAPVEPPLDAQAEALRRQGKPAESFALYGRALCASPADVTLALRFVDVWHELGAAGSVRASLARCKLSEGVVAFIDGLAAGARGEADGADALLVRAQTLVEESSRPEVAYRRGLVALGAHHPDRAQVALEEAAGLAPARVDVRLALAQALMDRGDTTASVTVLRGLMAVSPTSEEIRRARRMLQTAVARSEPRLAEDVERSVRDSLAELERGEPTMEALAHLQELAAEVNHPRVLMVAGLAALRRGQTNEATRLLEAAAALSPLDPAPWRALGSSYYAIERANDALRPLREAFARDPFDSEVAEMLAAASASVGEDRTARDTYRALTLLEPDVADHHLGVARMERRRGRPDAARAAAERGCSLEPQSVPLLLELASIDAELALKAPSAVERDQARERTRAEVDRLLIVAPNHPGAAAILESIKGG